MSNDQVEVELAIKALLFKLNQYERLVEIEIFTTSKVGTTIFDNPQLYEYHANVKFCQNISLCG